MAPSFSRQNRKVRYSKIRLYLNTAVAVLAMILSISLLTRLIDVVLLAYYLGLTAIVTFLMFKIKVFLLFKTQETSSRKEQLCTVGQIEDGTYAKKRQILILFGSVTLLILPLILVFFLEPAYWFVGFTSFVTGVGLSEIVLYLSTVR